MKTLTRFTHSLISLGLGSTATAYYLEGALFYMVCFFCLALLGVTLWGYNRGFDE